MTLEREKLALEKAALEKAASTMASSLKIKAVLPERFNRPVGFTKVLVAQIFDRTKSAIFLQAICQEFRLPESLNHLKRSVQWINMA